MSEVSHQEHFPAAWAGQRRNKEVGEVAAGQPCHLRGGGVDPPVLPFFQLSVTAIMDITATTPDHGAIKVNSLMKKYYLHLTVDTEAQRGFFVFCFFLLLLKKCLRSERQPWVPLSTLVENGVLNYRPPLSHPTAETSNSISFYQGSSSQPVTPRDLYHPGTRL